MAAKCCLVLIFMVWAFPFQHKYPVEQSNGDFDNDRFRILGLRIPHDRMAHTCTLVGHMGLEQGKGTSSSRELRQREGAAAPFSTLGTIAEPHRFQ